MAQFLVESTADAQDYARARREVRKLGIDPDRVPHDPPRTFVSDRAFLDPNILVSAAWNADAGLLVLWDFPHT